MAARELSRSRTRSRSPGHGSPQSRSPSRRSDRPSGSRISPRFGRDGGRMMDSPSRSRSRSRSRRSRDETPVQQRRDNYYSRSRSQSWSRSRSRGRHQDRSSHSPSGPPRSSKILIEKLTRNVHVGHLQEIFAAYGIIEEVDLPVNMLTGANRGSAYILFERPKDAEDAITHMHEAQLDGATISVSVALPRRRRSPSPLPLPQPPLRRASPAHWDDGRSSRGYDRSSHDDWPEPTDRRRGDRYLRRPAPDQYRSSLPSRGRPPRRGGRGGRGGRYRDFEEARTDADLYRRRSYSRSRSPRRRRSPSYDSMSRSRSRSPDIRHESRREGPPIRQDRRRSYSYSSYSSRSLSRSRSRSRTKSVSRSRDRHSGRRR